MSVSKADYNKQYNKTYYKKHKKRLAKYNKDYWRAYYKKNKKRLKTLRKKYAQKNKDKVNAHNRAWYARNKVKRIAAIANYKKTHKEKIESARLKNLYGISLKEFKLLKKQQKGLCAICGGRPSKKRALNVDHCHNTGVIRGLLCGLCNSGIGMLKDCPKTLQKAIEYLTKKSNTK